MKIKIAAAQYNIDFLSGWDDYRNKIGRWISEAASREARLLVFPEYASMELASLFPPETYSSLARQLAELQTLLDDYIELFRGFALQHRFYIQSGTFPVRMPNGQYRNRAFLFMPDGRVDYQDKMMMTRFENEQWLIHKGEELKCFETEFGKIGITVCYDSEFPLLARRLAEAGATLILVPSCTDTAAGYHRVRIGCQARALENQCYVVQSPTVGSAPWSEAVDVNVGAAAVYTPADRGFPDNGILAMGELNAVQWVFADIDPDNCARVRCDGQVFNYRDWPLHLATA